MILVTHGSPDSMHHVLLPMYCTLYTKHYKLAIQSMCCVCCYYYTNMCYSFAELGRPGSGKELWLRGASTTSKTESIERAQSLSDERCCGGGESAPGGGTSCRSVLVPLARSYPTALRRIRHDKNPVLFPGWPFR